ncbi:MAG: hypothetical protein JWM72_723, partial [Actinomycetia bacterium]|nr:hypothetical protein [Actinomycetes bacterium]
MSTIADDDRRVIARCRHAQEFPCRGRPR